LSRLFPVFDKIEILPASSAFEEINETPSTDAAASVSGLPAGAGADRPTVARISLNALTHNFKK
jgi:hypothetical protein